MRESIHLLGMALSQIEIDWAFEVLTHEVENEDCVDNHRIADASDPEEVAAYEAIRDGGCCGSFDTQIVHPKTGKTILIGCNYGH